MKQKLLFLLVLLLTAATGAWAQPWTSGDCTVTLSDGVLTVSGTGDMKDYEDYNQLPWNVYEIKTIVIESGVTSIGTYAFSYCSNLESVSIPASVTSIDELAFQGCGSDAAALTVSFAEGSTPLTIGESAFVNANLKSIDIPNRVTGIGRSAFSYCGNLESVSIPASVTSIGVEAFQSCGSDAAALTVSFAEGSTPLSISENAFYGAKLTSIDIPNRVTSIGGGAFASCSNLESVSIPASVTSIGAYAFGYCGKLAKVYIYAHSLETYGYGVMAFDGNADGRKIYVLPKAVDTYKAGWPAYAADIEAMPTYAITLAEGTEDAGKWTVKVGEGEAQELPLEGLEGGEKITVTYSGEKKVKSVKAVKKAAGLTYPIALSAVTAGYIGSVVTSDGNVYPAKTAVPAGKTAVGIVGKVTSTGHGLILALQNATEQEWETINGWTSVTTYAGTTLKVLPDNDARGSLSSYTTLGTTAVSNWAVAQKSDYEAIFTNLGSTQSDGFNGTTYDDNVNDFITTGVGGLAILGFYWSATEDSDFNQSWNFYNYCWTLNGKSTSYFVRPVLGF